MTPSWCTWCQKDTPPHSTVPGYCGTCSRYKRPKPGAVYQPTLADAANDIAEDNAIGMITAAGMDSVTIDTPMDGYARATVTMGAHTVTVPIDPNSTTPVRDALEAVARDQGIERATSSQSAIWVAQALAAVKLVAERQHELTADDVWDALKNGTKDEPTNRAAIAGILKTASGRKLRYVKATDRSAKSRAQGRHASRITVWMSLLFQPTTMALTDEDRELQGEEDAYLLDGER